MKGFLRFVLALLASFAILAGITFSIYAHTRVQPDGEGITLAVLAVLGWFPLALGFFLLRWRSRLGVARDPRPPLATGLVRFGIALSLFAVFATVSCLQAVGRLVMALVLFLVFTRIHVGWASERFRTPFGTMTWAQIFDNTVLGAAYLSFRVIIEVLAAALTGGKSIGVTGGGKFGGGGAHGRW